MTTAPTSLGETRTTVWLVRHGQSRWNLEGRIQGQADAPGLTDLGRKQAAVAADALSEHQLDLVVTSDLRRAVETADILADRLQVGIRVEPSLRERALGAAEGQPSEVLLGPGGGSGSQGGRVVDLDTAPPGGESVRQLLDRTGGYLRRLPRLGLGRRLVLVTHGGLMRAAVALASGRRHEGMPWPPIANAEVVRLELPLDGPTSSASRGSLPTGGVGE